MDLRPYHERDLPAVLHLVGECLRHDHLANYHPGDIVHWMSNYHRGADLGTHFRVAERGGEPIAVAWVPQERSSEWVLVLHPEHRGGETETGLLRACGEIMHARPADDAGRRPSTNVAVSQGERVACLTRLGYRGEPSAIVVSARSLAEPVSASSLPDGFRIRSAAGEHEAARLAAAHGGAFGSNWTPELYRQTMRTPGFDAEREIVAVAPDGRFAAFVVIWFDPVSRSGLFEPVGCHPDFRRLGLTRAVMLEGLRCMAAAGMTTALVGHYRDNEAAARLYGSVGFVPFVETIDFALPVS